MSSPLLSDDQIAAFRTIFTKIAVRGTAYGISVILVGLSAYILLGQGVRGSKSRSILLAVLLLMFLCSTGIFVANMVYSLAMIPTVGQEDIVPSPIVLKSYYALTIFSRINYSLSDSVVVWRAFILFQRRSLCRVILVLSLLVCWAGALIDCIFALVIGVTGGVLSPNRMLVLLLPMLFTNFLATLFIGWRTWYYHQFEHVKGSLVGENIKRALLLLVESGFAYCIILVLCIISLYPGTLSRTGAGILAGLFPHISAIYPTLIIILMSIQKISTLPGETVLSRSLQLSEAMMSSDQSEASSSLVVPGFRVQKEMV